MLTQVLALPKLNLQYLTFHDYLLRNFNLFRLESTYEIRQDVEDVALRLRYSIYSIYLPYWYRSTNTDAPRAPSARASTTPAPSSRAGPGTHVTCFPGTKTRILTPRVIRSSLPLFFFLCRSFSFLCCSFSTTSLSRLTPRAIRSSLPLSDFAVVEVAKPHLGETRPAHVLGEATYSLEGVRDQVNPRSKELEGRLL